MKLSLWGVVEAGAILWKEKTLRLGVGVKGQQKGEASGFEHVVVGEAF